MKDTNLRMAVASAVMVLMFVKVMLHKPERQIQVSQVRENLAGLEISPVAAILMGFVIIALATLFVHVWKGGNGINNNQN
mgnify:FL=1